MRPRDHARPLPDTCRSGFSRDPRPAAVCAGIASPPSRLKPLLRH